MRRKLSRVFLLVAAMLSLAATAQAEYPVVEWIRQLGTSSSDEGTGVSVDNSGNAYVAGTTLGDLDGNTNAGHGYTWLEDMFLTKYDTYGVKQWTKQLGSTTQDEGLAVSVDSSGNAYVTGYTYGGIDGNASKGNYDMFLTKYNTDGIKQWTRQLGTIRHDFGNGVSVDSNGSAYVTGSCSWPGLDGNTNAGGYDIFLTKFDTDGVKQWTRQLGSGSDDHGQGVSVDSSNVYIIGYTNGSLDGNISAGSKDMFLTKYDTDGIKRWTRQLGTSYWDEGTGVSVDSNGNVYTTGWTLGDLDGNKNAGNHDMFLTKYNTDGIKQWTRQLGSTSRDEGCGISVDSIGNAYVAGFTYGNLDGNTNSGAANMFLTKYNTDGDKLWTCQLGTASGEYGYGVSVDGSGSAYVTGFTRGNLGGNTNAGGKDMFLIKISYVPEPGSLAMLAGIALAMILCCKRKWDLGS